MQKFWENNRLYIRLDKISLCYWEDEPDDEGLPGPFLLVYFEGDEDPLQLNQEEGSKLVEDWKAYLCQ